MMRGNVVSRREIEEKIKGMGDYVRIDYLSRCLDRGLDLDTRKFVLVRLAGLYEARKMFSEAAKLLKAAATINTTIKAQIQDFLKSGELFIKGGIFEDADASFSKALALANTREKSEIKYFSKEAYKTQAKNYLNVDKRSNAVKTYEKLLRMDLDVGEREEVKKMLLELYSKLGKIREFYALEKKS
tara:strand:+ start:1683 stop:2240 length:558 start_codon:yes stop_codon:yes gene_type:complete